MPHKFPAFSLIEVAIVLIIMGLMGGMALPMLKGMLDWQRATTTAQNQEKILYALASYAAQYKALPYAANPADQKGKQDYARRRGIVPYAELGLPESTAKDGHHHWLTYVVDGYYAVIPKVVISGSVTQQPINKLCEKRVQEKEKQDNPLKIKGAQDNIALVLISHGPQGRGAYPNPLAAPPQGEDEAQNAASDTQIIDRPLSQDPSNPFSHKVVWVTAKNLLAIYAHAPCPPLEDYKPQSGSYSYQSTDPQKMDFQKMGKKPESGEGRHQPLSPPPRQGLPFYKQ